MMETIYNKFCKHFSSLISKLAITTVNSACMMGLGQLVEPESLQRFKVNQ